MTQNLSYNDVMRLVDQGYHVYEIWKEPIYVGTNYGRRSGRDVYTDPVLQVQAFSDTNRLPLKVGKRFPPHSKIKTSANRWRWTAGDSVEMMLTVFGLAGYEIVRAEPHIGPFGSRYTLYFVAGK